MPSPADSAHYDEAFYREYRGRLNQYWWARRFYAALIMRYRRSGRLLEIGCGLGDVLRRLENDFETYGIELSEYAVARARENCPRTQVSVAAAEDVAALPGPFDVIASFHVVEHLQDPAEILKLWASCTRPGAMMVLATPNPEAPFAKKKGDRWHGHIPSHISIKTSSEWAGLTEAAGFRVRRVFGDGLWDVPYVPLIPNPLQLAVFGLPAVIQTLTTIPFIPVRFAESTIIVAERQ